ncbi:MAG TPA: hypothetical protein VFE46_07445, partial [Pirellulales bacterium]|nr:hypothetical protein [Pirellulales bacterium]
MSILQSINRLGRLFRGDRFWRRDDPHCAANRLRVCGFEHLEVRNPLTVSPLPIHLGSTYLEPASGDDSKPNVILVSFQGGAPGTQLTQLVIDGDKDQDGKFSSGEVFFDTAPGGWGDFDSN